VLPVPPGRAAALSRVHRAGCSCPARFRADGVRGGGSLGIMGVLPVSPEHSLEPACPYMSLALGTVVRAGYCCYVRADQILISPLRSPGSFHGVVYPGKGVIVHGQDEEGPGIAGARRCRRGGDR
jgi:hypothetical protein